MIKITLPGGAFHLVEELNEAPDIEGYSSSSNTQAALQAAYDAGDWEPYEPPQAEPELLPPDWPAFRLALMQSESFRAWSEMLPATWREDLKLSAIAANLEALQSVYNVIKGDYPPAVEAVEEWADLAERHSIPMGF